MIMCGWLPPCHVCVCVCLCVLVRACVFVLVCLCVCVFVFVVKTTPQKTRFRQCEQLQGIHIQVKSESRGNTDDD